MPAIRLAIVVVPEKNRTHSLPSPSFIVPEIAADLEILNELTLLRELADRALAERLEFPAGCPPRLAEAIRYVVLAPGKRLRPILALLAAQACGGQRAQALPAACAVELVHAYSLVHDDLPAMDDDDLRRGLPTCHKVYDEATAILVGDALQAYAFELLATELPADIAAQACALLARAAGASQLVGGQADDLAGAEACSDLEHLQAIHHRKTGAMILASLELGALTAGASEEQQAALTEFGERFGLVFQITDDLLDASGNQDEVGKRVGKDAERGKLTYPVLLGEEKSRQLVERLTEESKESLIPLGESAAPLRYLAQMLVDRNR